METPDKKLLQLCRDKKRDGYSLLFKKYQNFIYKICYHYTVSREDALDLVQEVYIKVFKSIDRFDESYSILPWIKRITVNTCLNFMRSNRQKTISLDSPVGDESTVEDLIASSVSVEDQVTYKDTKKELEDLIRELPEEMRMAVILRHVQGMQYDEIAKTMSCPVGTVKTYIFRGRKMLKDKLQSEGFWEV